MVREVPTTQNTIQINARVQETGGPRGEAQFMQNVSQYALQERDEYQAKTKENAYLQGQATLTRDLERIKREYPNDPDSLTTALEEYGQSFLDEISDPDMVARYSLQLTKSAQSAISEATARRKTIIDEEARFQTYQTIDMVENELANTAVNLYSADPTVALAASEQMQEIMSRGQQALNRVDSNGVPLLSAKERATTLLAVRDSSFKAAASAWFEGQENKLAAVQEWLDGNVTIELPDENGEMTKINLRETMPEASRAKVDNDLMNSMRDRISIQNHQNTMQDKRDADLADALFIEHQTRVQDGAFGTGIEPLSLQELDATRQQYLAGGRENEFIALRDTLIEGGVTTEDGTIRNQLMNMAYMGQDPADFGRLAVRDRRVSWQTVQEAQRIYQSQTGPSTDIPSFYTNQLVRALGGQNQNLDIAGQEIISRATIELNTQFKQLQQEGQLNDSTARTVFDRVLENNSNLDLDARITARSPQFIPNSEVGLAASAERAKDFQNQILDHFLEKHGSDFDKIKTDPDYIAAQKWLQDYKGQIRQGANRIK